MSPIVQFLRDVTNNTVFENNLCDLISDDEFTLVVDIFPHGEEGLTSLLNAVQKVIRMRFNSGDCGDHPLHNTPPNLLNVAESILHESYHAFFRYDFLASIGAVSQTEFRNQWAIYARERLGMPNSIDEHHLMIEWVMNQEAQALMDLNGGLHTIEHYKWLIWEGYSHWFADAVDAATVENWKNLYNSIKDEPYAFKCK